MHEYEEYKEWSTGKSWLFIILLSASVIGFAMSLMIFIEEVPREWDFDNLEYTPGASVYSTGDPGELPDQKMIHPLPEGVSMEKEQKKNNKQPSGQ